MQSQIVVPLDGTRAAERALPTAVALAGATGSTMTLVRAVSPVPLYHPTCRAELIPIVYERFQEEWQVAGGYLRELAGQLCGHGISVRSLVEYGDPASAIVAQAPNHSPSLIVMATNQRRGMDRWSFGSRAEQVLRRAHVPVLLVSGTSQEMDGGGTWSLRTIVAVLEGSDADAATLKEARSLAAFCGATIVLAAITRQPGAGRQFWRHGRSEDASGPAPRDYRGWRLTLGATGVRQLHIEAESVDAFLRACVGEAPDLVILPPYRRGFLRRPALSRALMLLVHEAGLPVLVMPKLVAARAPQGGRTKNVIPRLSPLTTGKGGRSTMFSRQATSSAPS